MKASSFARRGERRRGMRVGEASQLAQLQNAIYLIAVQAINTPARSKNSNKKGSSHHVRAFLVGFSEFYANSANVFFIFFIAATSI
jgi:hypothetical protein